jgi:hypothetical protein
LFLPIRIFAEVSDKMMSWPALWSWVFVIPLVTWALLRKSKWLVVLPLPLAALLALGSFDSWRDPYIGPAVVEELGYLYLMLGFVPLISIGVLFLVVKKKTGIEAASGKSGPGDL